MNADQLFQSIHTADPPAGLSVYLQSLWHDAKGDWEAAHDLIQHLDDREAAWIHAYLHRKEGDTGNADYWYRRAGRTRPSVSLQQEWRDLANTLSTR